MKFDCPHCAQNLEISEEWAGYQCNCPACQQPITVPAPARDPVKTRPATARPPARGTITANHGDGATQLSALGLFAEKH